MPKYTEERVGKNVLAVPHALGIAVYDLSRFKGAIEDPNKDMTDRNSKRWDVVRAIGRLFWKAIDNPGVVVREFFEEPNYEYMYSALYDPQSMRLASNQWCQAKDVRANDTDLNKRLRDDVQAFLDSLPPEALSTGKP